MSSDVMFVPRRMHRSPAFRKLTASSILVLFEFLYRRQMVELGRRDRWVTKNNGEIVLTYAETTTRFRIARSTFRNSIDQLVKLGFIDIIVTTDGHYNYFIFHAIKNSLSSLRTRNTFLFGKCLNCLQTWSGEFFDNSRFFWRE